MSDNLLVYAAVYDFVSAATADLDAIERLHEDGLIGKFDAAVVDEENGKPHIVKRIDRPRIRVIPEAFGAELSPARSSKRPRRRSLPARPG
jgi:hypothetical protein